MKNTQRYRHPRNAFTLLELLIVIAIIGILASVLTPVLGTIKVTALKMSAKNDATQLVMAISSYQTDYGRLPLKENADEDPAPILSEAPFMIILLAEEEGREGEAVLNRRGTVYFEGRLQSKPGGHGLDRDGNFYDPWGNPYQIFLDGNYDKRIMVLEEEIRRAIGVRSMGPDEKFEVPEDEGKSDDIKSWK